MSQDQTTLELILRRAFAEDDKGCRAKVSQALYFVRQRDARTLTSRLVLSITIAIRISMQSMFKAFAQRYKLLLY